MLNAAPRRTALLTPLLCAALLIFGMATPAHAKAPDDEGGTAELREQLEAASKGWLAAKAQLDGSVKRQKELGSQLKALEAEHADRSEALGELVASAYRTGRLGPLTALLNSSSPDGFLDRAAALLPVAANEDRELRALADTQEKLAQANAAIQREILEQRKQVATMAARKKQAEKALEVAGRSQAVSGPSGDGGADADPGPSGSGGCTINDPTTSGCITPRLLHALNEAKQAGYTRYVSCYRSGGSGEHPKGRACDFAAQKDGFGGDATGGDRTYGNNLASFFIRNSDALGVLYVIWYRQIWLPSSGWRSYSGAGGDPSSDHTNHVHLSVT
jgi:peptidoglycan DL-endopeptidase CwlO